MNEDYLWNRTGEADEEVRRLETLLGELRYEPRPLALSLPARQVRPAAPRIAAWRLVAVAAVALLSLGVGMWLGLSRQTANNHEPQIAESDRQSPTPEIGLSPSPENNAAQPTSRSEPTPKSSSRATKRGAARPDLKPRSSPRPSEIQAAIVEGERAKEQLLLALHVASAKLNIAQKKVRHTGEPQS